MASLHCIFAVGLDISILRAPMAAAISPFSMEISIILKTHS